VKKPTRGCSRPTKDSLLPRHRKLSSFVAPLSTSPLSSYAQMAALQGPSWENEIAILNCIHACESETGWLRLFCYEVENIASLIRWVTLAAFIWYAPQLLAKWLNVSLLRILLLLHISTSCLVDALASRIWPGPSTHTEICASCGMAKIYGLLNRAFLYVRFCRPSCQGIWCEKGDAFL
jgi:hypothetical protein